MMKKIVTLFSGGTESSLILARLLQAGHEVFPLLVDYGQNRREIESAQAVHAFCASSFGGILHPLKIFSVGDLTQFMVDGAYIPHRNAIFCSLAAAYAAKIGAADVSVGFIESMRSPEGMPITDGLFDQSPNFVVRINNLYAKSHALPAIFFDAPLMMSDKADTIKELRALGLERTTWSCHDVHSDEPCGKCSACLVRDYNAIID